MPICEGGNPFAWVGGGINVPVPIYASFHALAVPLVVKPCNIISNRLYDLTATSMDAENYLHHYPQRIHINPKHQQYALVVVVWLRL